MSVFFVIASAAKQSRGRKQELDCFVAALLAMTDSDQFTPAFLTFRVLSRSRAGRLGTGSRQNRFRLTVAGGGRFPQRTNTLSRGRSRIRCRSERKSRFGWSITDLSCMPPQNRAAFQQGFISIAFIITAAKRTQ
jgi:hypothetical protein